MRRGFGLIWLAVTAVVATVTGAVAYQAGWAAGLATRLPAGDAGPYYLAPHPFFGFFGFFGFLPFLFLLAVLLFAFRAGRWGRWGRGPGGWGYGRFPGGPPPTAGTTPAAPSGADDPLHGWPQRPPDEQPEPGRRQA